MAELEDGGALLNPETSALHPAPVACQPREKRRTYRTEHGNQNPIVLYCWDCPVTAEHIASSSELDARQAMLQHDCGGAGWCPTPFAYKATVDPRFVVTVQDRERWKAQRAERLKREKAARKAAREASA